MIPNEVVTTLIKISLINFSISENIKDMEIETLKTEESVCFKEVVSYLGIFRMIYDF